MLQTTLQCGLDPLRVIHIDIELAQIALSGFAGALLNLFSNEVSPVIGLLSALADAVRYVDIAEGGHQHEHHTADSQHQLCFEADSYHGSARDERGDGGIITALVARQKHGVPLRRW